MGSIPPVPASDPPRSSTVEALALLAARTPTYGACATLAQSIRAHWQDTCASRTFLLSWHVSRYGFQVTRGTESACGLHVATAGGAGGTPASAVVVRGTKPARPPRPIATVNETGADAGDEPTGRLNPALKMRLIVPGAKLLASDGVVAPFNRAGAVVEGLHSFDLSRSAAAMIESTVGARTPRVAAMRYLDHPASRARMTASCRRRRASWARTTSAWASVSSRSIAESSTLRTVHQ